jgi:hypothetical protein
MIAIDLAAAAAPAPLLESPGWSSSEPAHNCLRDVERTEAFLAAIARVVRPGDVVVEAGAGSGVLSLAAAAAGAGCVYAVELDPFLARCLRRTVALNGFADRIAVVCGDVRDVALPRAVDLLVAELIDTGLLDEGQVPVLNALHERGVIGPATRLIPARYRTFADLIELDDRAYGFRFAAPVHDWRTFRLVGSRWHPLALRPLTGRAAVAEVDFRRPVEPRLMREVVLTARDDGVANGVRLSGVAHLGDGAGLGATNAMNGDKILPLADPVPVRAGERLVCRVDYVMGGGLGTFAWRRLG